MPVETHNRHPIVSVGIPTFNGGNRLVRAIESVLKQDYDDFEIVISDNCSTDDTDKLIYRLLLQDSRIKYFRQQENIGMAGNFDFVLQNSSGSYFMWLADDDTLVKRVIKQYVEFLDSHPDYVLVSGEIQHWDKSKLVYIEKGFTLENPSGIARALRYYLKVTHCGMYHGLMRRDAISGMSHKNIMGNDWHMIARLAYTGKFKNFGFPGYDKVAGGVSENLPAYARSIGGSFLSVFFTHIDIACGAFSEIMRPSFIYFRLPSSSRLFFATAAFFSVLINYYGIIFPRKIAGKIKRTGQHLYARTRLLTKESFPSSG